VSELSAQHLITYSVCNFGFDILVFISHFIELLHISFPNVLVSITIKTIGQLNFVTVTSYLNNLCVFLLEDGQKVNRNVYLLN